MCAASSHLPADIAALTIERRARVHYRTLTCLDCTMNIIGALVLILMVLFACHQVAHLPDRARATCPTAAC